MISFRNKFAKTILLSTLLQLSLLPTAWAADDNNMTSSDSSDTAVLSPNQPLDSLGQNNNSDNAPAPSDPFNSSNTNSDVIGGILNREDQQHRNQEEVKQYYEHSRVINRKYAVLQFLNKTTATTQKETIRVGLSAEKDGLIVRVKACQERPPELVPESAAFIQVFNRNNNKEIFSGWMFASSPSLSPFQDPLYDIYVLGCSDTPPAVPPLNTAPQGDDQAQTEQSKDASSSKDSASSPPKASIPIPAPKPADHGKP